eukprot:Opistho-2@96979
MANLVKSIPETVSTLRATFATGRTRDIAWRKAQLEAFERMINDHKDALIESVQKDLRRPKFECHLGEIALLQTEVGLALANLSSWMKPEKLPTPLLQVKGVSQCLMEPQPLGTVLVIGAWNYPCLLLLQPAIGAIAAGNAVVMKPSEVSANTSKLIAELVPKYLDREAIVVIEGAVDETTALLKEKFDHIFYTGNGAVGKIVLRAAAEHLTPVTLELGGKSPCIVDAGTDIEIAARRIINGKFFNAGQTCVAPDYLLVHEKIYGEFVEKLKGYIVQFFGEDPQKSSDLARIVNARHHRRIADLLKNGGANAKIVAGGKLDEADLYIAPTLVTDVDPASKLMQEEIFGPVLPILKITTIDEAISFVNARAKPLALYVFPGSSATKNAVQNRTTSGGFVVNDVIVHVACGELPFGGVGESGMGRYHGKFTFDTFSHQRGVLDKTMFLDLPIRYPPYSDSKLGWVKMML